MTEQERRDPVGERRAARAGAVARYERISEAVGVLHERYCALLPAERRWLDALLRAEAQETGRDGGFGWFLAGLSNALDREIGETRGGSCD